MADFREELVEPGDMIAADLSDGVSLPILDDQELTTGNPRKLSDLPHFPQRFFTFCSDVRKEHPRGPLPFATRFRDDIEHDSIRGTAEWTIVTKIRLWKCEKIDNHTAELDVWPATSTEPEYSSKSQDPRAIKLFVFKDDHLDSHSESYLVPIRYTPGHLAAPASVQIDGGWIPLEEWIGKTFARPKPKYDEVDLRIFRTFSERYGGKKLNFLRFPLEIRELIYDQTFPESILAFGFKIRNSSPSSRSLFTRSKYYYKYPLGTLNRQLRVEFNRRLARKCVISFAGLGYMEKFFRQANLDWLNQIRHIRLGFTTYTELFDLFGARLSNDFRRIPSWVAPLFRHMRDLRELSLTMPLTLYYDHAGLENPKKRGNNRGGSSDRSILTQHEIAEGIFKPEMFHNGQPCQKAVAGWVLEAAFPWIYHIPELHIRFVKLSQLDWLETLRKPLLDKIKSQKSRPVTKDLIRNAKQAVIRATDGHRGLSASVHTYENTVHPVVSIDKYGMRETKFHPERIAQALRKFHEDENYNMKLLYREFNNLSRKSPVKRYWISNTRVSNIAPRSFRAELGGPECTCSVKCSRQREYLYTPCEGNLAVQHFEELRQARELAQARDNGDVN